MKIYIYDVDFCSIATSGTAKKCADPFSQKKSILGNFKCLQNSQIGTI